MWRLLNLSGKECCTLLTSGTSPPPLFTYGLGFLCFNHRLCSNNHFSALFTVYSSLPVMWSSLLVERRTSVQYVSSTCSSIQQFTLRAVGGAISESRPPSTSVAQSRKLSNMAARSVACLGLNALYSTIYAPKQVTRSLQLWIVRFNVVSDMFCTWKIGAACLQAVASQVVVAVACQCQNNSASVFNVLPTHNLITHLGKGDRCKIKSYRWDWQCLNRERVSLQPQWCQALWLMQHTLS